ncbi:MAG: adenylate kinase [Candidatus Diapherotrites archaeon]|nr:adenylate kinase [Candidatus Diapherotrites archaeon]
MPLNLVFIGPPGAGKGTVAGMVAREWQIPHLSTGEMLRSEIAKASALGKFVQSIVASGGLVDDQTVSQIVEQRIKEQDCLQGFILDGFPRNVQQAIILDGLLAAHEKNVSAAVLFFIPEEALVKRLSGRRYCPKCSRTYNMYTPELMPKKDSVCNDCGVILQQRADDRSESVRKRLHIYNTHIAPLLKFYQEKNLLLQLKADGSIQENVSRLKELLKH